MLINLLAPRNDAYLPQFYDELMATNQKPILVNASWITCIQL